MLAQQPVALESLPIPSNTEVTLLFLELPGSCSNSSEPALIHFHRPVLDAAPQVHGHRRAEARCQKVSTGLPAVQHVDHALQVIDEVAEAVHD
eukprot:15452318-Alexandrium_andersonii.AAC.1